MANYELWYTTDTGSRIALLDNTHGGVFWRVTNGVGTFSLRLPASFSTTWLKRDRMVQVWRAPATGRLALWRAYFVRWWRFQRIGSELEIEVRGPCVNDLLRRRIVAAYAESANATKTATEADDMMKDITADMESDAIAPVPTAGTRAWADLTTQGDLTDGPQLNMAFAWRNVLEVIRDISKASRTAGTEVFFDVVPASIAADSISLQFRTRTGQPGQDLTDLGVTFDEQRGNLINPSISYDYRDEITYVYAGGQGEETDRNIQQVYDADRYSASAWNRCEAFASAIFEETDNGVREAGRAKLAEGEPVITFSAQLADTAGFRFGLDWNWGDKVTARFLGQNYDVIIRKVGIYLDEDGRETIEARLESEE